MAPFVWLLVYTASLFVLMGARRPDLAIVGASLLLVAFGVAVYLAIGPKAGRPPPRGYAPLMGGLGAFHLISAAATLGPAYAGAALLAGTIPMTAATLRPRGARRGPARTTWRAAIRAAG